MNRHAGFAIVNDVNYVETIRQPGLDGKPRLLTGSRQYQLSNDMRRLPRAAA